jgi:hydroxypyruvate isomerase
VSAFRLAVSAEMVFLDRPFTERVRRIAGLGFEVELWDWTTKDLHALTSPCRSPSGSTARG